MNEETPLASLPADVLEGMSPGERLAYLVHAGEDVPAEVAERSRQAYANSWDHRADGA